MREIRLKARAKINLTLDVTGKREDGYHLLETIMQTVALYDGIYMKKLEKFIEKFKKNPDFIYDKEYDKVSVEENQKLYELYIEKLQNTIYSKRINSPVQILMDGQEWFEKLNIKEQCVVLMNIQTVFGRMTSGCDLSLIGGSPNSGATVNFSSTISNWRKNYSDVRIIDQSPSGIWEKRSENILELL